MLSLSKCICCFLLKCVCAPLTQSHHRLGTQLTKKRSNKKEFQDLVEELSIDLVNKEVEKEAEKAKRTALDEHAILHRVTAMWLGLGMKETFAEWKTWVQRRVSQVDRDNI